MKNLIIAAIVIVTASSNCHAQFGIGRSLKNLGRKIDPTNKNSATRQGLKDIDPTNRNSSLRNHLRKNDPWEATKLEAYRQVRNRYVSRLGGKRPVFLRPGNAHYDRLRAAVYPNGQSILPFDFRNVEFYFGCNINNQAAAMTFGNKVLVARQYDPADATLTTLMAHELAHVLQVRAAGGEDKFVRRSCEPLLPDEIPTTVCLSSETHQRRSERS